MIITLIAILINIFALSVIQKWEKGALVFDIFKNDILLISIIIVMYFLSSQVTRKPHNTRITRLLIVPQFNYVLMLTFITGASFSDFW